MHSVSHAPPAIHSETLFRIPDVGPDESEAKMLTLFEKWREGGTGVPIIDAVMRELKATGYASNRARLIASSFLVRDLGVPFYLGALHFQSVCIDYDPCINWG
jgi:deoxyribodipyrimidine photolyase